MIGDFNFGTVAPIIQGLLDRKKEEVAPPKILPLLSSAEQPLISEQPPEQISGTEIVNRAMLPTIPQAPNPYAVNLQRQVTAQKQAYADAKDDAGRQAANSQAELYRNMANAAGIDMSGYGSDVSLSDAYKNLASQEAQAITQALQGYYARNSNQYRNDKYLEGIARGYSPRQARQVADLLAGDYQADRVEYLDGLLNSYGRDGLVTTEYGNQFIAKLLGEEPALANFYAQIYPNAKDAYSTANDIAQEAAKQGYALELLGAGRDVDLTKIEATLNANKDLETHRAGLSQDTYAKNKGVDYYYDEKAKDNAIPRNLREYKGKAKIDTEELILRAREQTGLDLSKFKEEKSFLAALEKAKPSDVKKTYDKWAEYGAMRGLKGEELERFAVDGVGATLEREIAIKGAGKGNDSSDSVKLSDLITLRNSYLKEKADLMKSGSDDFGNIDEKTQQDIESVNQKIAILDEEINRQKGTEPQQNEAAKFTGDWNKDKALIADIREEGKRRGLSWQQIKQKIYDYMVSQGIDENYARGAVGLD